MQAVESFFGRLLKLIKSFYSGIYYQRTLSIKLATTITVGTSCFVIYHHLYQNKKSVRIQPHDEHVIHPDPPSEVHVQEPLDRYRLNSAVMSGAAAKSYREITPRPPAAEEPFIKCICLIVVVDAEVQPMMHKYQFIKDEELTKKFMNLAVVSSKKNQWIRYKNYQSCGIKGVPSSLFRIHSVICLSGIDFIYY
eukprot:663353_1